MGHVRLQRWADGAGATIVIDRVEAKNAFTNAMWTEAADIFHAVGADESVSVAVLTGAGDVFCAGADITDLNQRNASQADAGLPFHHFIDTLAQFPVPLIAAVNGAAVGAGFSMLNYADLVIAASAARFRAPFVAMGLCPEAGSSALLPARIGWQNASHLFLTGAWLDAERAAE